MIKPWLIFVKEGCFGWEYIFGDRLIEMDPPSHHRFWSGHSPCFAQQDFTTDESLTMLYLALLEGSLFGASQRLDVTRCVLHLLVNRIKHTPSATAEIDTCAPSGLVFQMENILEQLVEAADCDVVD